MGGQKNKMVLFNHIYKNIEDLKTFIENNDISENVLIQVFSSNTSRELLIQIKNQIKELLPKSSLIATTTAGIVDYGHIVDNEVVISFSSFKASSVKDVAYSKKSAEDIISDLKSNYINDRTKLIVAFADIFNFDISSLLSQLGKTFPDLAIAGGYSADDLRFQSCTVLSSKQDDCDIVFAIVDSDVLEIKTEYFFNWETVGRSMTVTKSEGNIVYEIDNKPVADIYEHYLGKVVRDNILQFGIEFPLVFKDGGTVVARVPALCDDSNGSIRFVAPIPEGKKVKFGYANIDYIEEQNYKYLNSRKYKNEALYVYTCASRRSLGDFFTKEILALNTIGKSVGFITYGEFFHNIDTNSNNLLNITTTFITLNENLNKEEKTASSEANIKSEISRESIRLNAFSRLLKQTSEEIDENIFYLEQFKKAIDEVTISSTTNEQGIITSVNENFEKISGYFKEELIGKPHNIVRHPDMSREAFKNLWNDIQAGKLWQGVLKNRKKDGTPYYVLTEISPIYNKDGSLKEYIGVRNDITELEEYKDVLKKELSSTRTSLEEHMYYVKQYEDAINSTVAIVKTDKSSTITYANDTFCKLIKYDFTELIGKSSVNFVDLKLTSENINANSLDTNTKQINIQYTLKTKDGFPLILDTFFYPIYDKNGEIVEYLYVMNDITEIVNLNEEIIDTQKEVVATMGEIGETRSKETGMHVVRVAEYSYILAQLVGLSKDEARILKQASPMHDIGKVGIPDSILNKPGKLTPEEFEVMKTHAEIGYDMLKHSKREILKASAIVALTHHEKWDGSGYPKGLKGEEIHIFGRITAIADVFDALAHDRVYKKAWELDKILKLFKEERGKHFDPNLIDIFFNNLDKFLEIKNTFVD